MSGENLQWSTKFAGLPRRHIGWCLMWFCQICRWHQSNPARQVPSAIFWSRFSSPQIAHGQPILCWWSSGLEIPGAADGAIQLGSVRVGGTPHRMFLLIPWSGCTGSFFCSTASYTAVWAMQLLALREPLNQGFEHLCNGPLCKQHGNVLLAFVVLSVKSCHRFFHSNLHHGHGRLIKYDHACQVDLMTIGSIFTSMSGNSAQKGFASLVLFWCCQHKQGSGVGFVTNSIYWVLHWDTR